MDRLLANILHRRTMNLSVRACEREREKERDSRDNFSTNNNDRLELYRSCYSDCAFFFSFFWTEDFNETTNIFIEHLLCPKHTNLRVGTNQSGTDSGILQLKHTHTNTNLSASYHSRQWIQYTCTYKSSLTEFKIRKTKSPLRKFDTLLLKLSYFKNKNIL